MNLGMLLFPSFLTSTKLVPDMFPGKAALAKKGVSTYMNSNVLTVLVDGAESDVSRSVLESLARSRLVGSHNVIGSLGWTHSANAIRQCDCIRMWNKSKLHCSLEAATAEDYFFAICQSTSF